MKRLQEYIIESTAKTSEEWFKNVYKQQQTLIKDGKAAPIKIDTKKIKGTEKPCKIKDILSNQEELNLINDKLVGFPILSNLLQLKNKYFRDNDSKKDYDVYATRYFYDGGEGNTYSIGYLLTDESIQYIENFQNIIGFDILPCIENSTEIYTFILNNLNDTAIINKKRGLMYKKSNPKIWGLLSKFGFSVSKDNKNWLTKTIKQST